MYRHILIPTDGSELAGHAVTNGLSLAKSVGAKVTVIIAEEPFAGSAFQKRNAAGTGGTRQTCRADQEARCECVESRGQCGQGGRCVLRHDSGGERATL